MDTEEIYYSTDNAGKYFWGILCVFANEMFNPRSYKIGVYGRYDLKNAILTYIFREIYSDNIPEKLPHEVSEEAYMSMMYSFKYAIGRGRIDKFQEGDETVDDKYQNIIQLFPLYTDGIINPTYFDIDVNINGNPIGTWHDM